MTTSEFDRGRKDVEGGVLEEPKSDLDTPTFSDDTAASGSFDMSGNTSILDGIYGVWNPLMSNEFRPLIRSISPTSLQGTHTKQHKQILLLRSPHYLCLRLNRSLQL